jgi:pyrroloquinoline quinone biosynthesis protein D
MTGDVGEATIGAASVPRVGRGFRLQWEPVQEPHVLLYPLGMVRLNGSTGEILSRCAGVRSVGALVVELEQCFGQQGLERDVLAYLDIARAQRWVEIA